MIALTGKNTHEMSRKQLDNLIAQHQHVVIDLGAGDGKWAYRRAQAHPDELVIAIEPVRENVRETSAKAAKKPDRGGLPNVLYVQGAVEQLPAELSRVAHAVYVTLPWGSLMRGIILADPAALSAIASLGRIEAEIHIVLNTRIFEEPVPLDARDLREVTPEYVRSLEPAFNAAGLALVEAREMLADEVAALGTTWAKRLSHRAPPPSVYLRLRRTGDA